MIAIIHPKKRKAHIAAVAGDLFLPLCDASPAPAGTTPFQTIHAAEATINPTDTTVCVHCRRMIAFVHVIHHLDTIRPDGHRHLTAA